MAYDNGNVGIYVEWGSTVIGNTSRNNGSHGIFVGRGTTVKNNTAYVNDEHGIALFGENLVDGNTAWNNNQSAGGFANIGPCPTTCTYGDNHAP